MKTIKLTKGYETIVDDDDFEWLNQFKWHINTNGYARRTQYIKGSGRKTPKSYKIYMHNLINKTPVGLATDHINRNKLDNRKCNLRTVTDTQNNRNMGLLSTNTSGYKGVSWSKIMKKWESYLWLQNKKINLGYFANIQEAIIARKNGEKQYYAI